ncbi:MAG: YhaI family protein [Nanoarchaeota archaeon]|nr:YhaI family protein [Nanoarchaeota archaeon]
MINKSIIGKQGTRNTELGDINELIKLADSYKEPIKIKEPKKKNPEPQNFQTSANIVKSDYIQLPQFNKLISKFELLGYNNLNWEDTHFKLHENGLYMPLIPEFMTHFKNVVLAYQSKGKNPLFDGEGNTVSIKEVRDIYKHMTKDYLAIYGTQKGAWSWLDAKFKEDNGMKILFEHRTFVDSNGKKILTPNKTENLESCVREDCYVDFNNLNSQGLPTTVYPTPNYEEGKNIYYWKPVDGKVARFFALSSGALLSCYTDPSDTNTDLGVYGIAEQGK